MLEAERKYFVLALEGQSKDIGLYMQRHNLPLHWVCVANMVWYKVAKCEKLFAQGDLTCLSFSVLGWVAAMDYIPACLDCIKMSQCQSWLWDVETALNLRPLCDQPRMETVDRRAFTRLELLSEEPYWAGKQFYLQNLPVLFLALHSKDWWPLSAFLQMPRRHPLPKPWQTIQASTWFDWLSKTLSLRSL